MSSVSPQLDGVPISLRKYATLACELLGRQGLEISGIMRTHQLKLADRQCSMIDISRRVQEAVVMLVTALYAGKQNDPVTQAACEVICAQLSRSLLNRRATHRQWRQVTELGATLANEGWRELEGIDTDSIMMPYAR